MPYLIKQPRNWRMRLGNAGRSASLSILISCFLCFFLLHAVSVQADIVLSPDTVQVTATTGQTDPITRTIHLFDDNLANFEWTATWDKDWLELDPSSGDGSSTYNPQLTINPEGLSEGTYTGTITIHTDLGDLTVNVTLEIKRAPGQVRVSPDTVQVTATTGQTDPITRTIHLFDDNLANFEWTATWDKDWLELDPSSGNATSYSYDIQLKIKPEGLSEGTHNGIVTIFLTDSNSTQLTIDVTLEIVLPKDGELGVSPLNLEFVAKKSEPSPIKSVRVFNRTNEYDEFVWSAVASDWWILLYDGHSCDQQESGGFSPAPATSVSCNSIGCQCFDVSIDSESMQPGDYNGTITIYSNLEDNSTRIINVTARVERYETQEIEESISTSSWLDLRLEIPQNDLRDENGNPGNFYLLVEHPSLLPGRVFAYRRLEKPGCSPTECGQDSDCRFDLFSQWGHLVPDAWNLAYQSDREWDLQQDVLTVPFGGFRLIGLEGDIIIHGMVGTPKPGQDWGVTRLLKYTLHVVPLTGTWIVTDEFWGKTFTYSDPLVLYESRGQLEGAWRDAWLGWWDPDNNINYVNPSDVIPGPPSISGSRIVVVNSSSVSGYDLHFTEWSPVLNQNFEYWYQITDLNQGSMQGFWRYRGAGEEIWSIPQAFSAVQQSVVISLNPSCNCYLVNGTVNGYAIGFIVDTGAFAVLLDLADAPYMGLVDEETGWLNSRCDPTPVMLGGVGGTITAYKCYVDIEIEGRLSRQNVEAYLSEGQSALLGMTFLDRFHISTNSEDGTMIIAP
jgi:predicted aspartyl protease